MRKSLFLFVCICLAFQIHAQPELKGSPADLAKLLAGIPKTVMVTGEGELKVPADEAVITLKISTENKSFRESLRLNQEIRGKLLDYLKKQGIPLDRVQAAKFSSTPKYGWLSEKAKSYHVDNLIKITVLDEQEFQAASGAVDAWSEVQYLSVEFEQKDKDVLKAQVIAKACDNANERRKVYEDKFGVRLVPKGFSEGRVAPQSPILVTNASYERDNSLMARPSMATPITSVEAGEVAEGVSPFGELTYATQVVVEYSVEPK